MPDPVQAAASPAFAYCPAPVFVIGAPRSGTTALGKALGRHSRFYAGDETFFLVDLFGDGRAETVHARWAGRPSSSWLRRERVSLDDFLAALGVGINALLTTGADGLRWVDHTPAHAFMAGTLSRMFPGAAFLHMLRDGCEVVNSMINVPRTLPGDAVEQMRQAQFLPEWTRDFRVACETWRSHVRAAADFSESHPGRCLTVLQQDLEANPARTLAAVLRFLDAPYEERPANFLRQYRLNSSFAPPGGCRARDYRRPDPQTTWTDQQRAIFAEVAGPEMEALGLA
jgi:Sulfotransferase family